MTQASEILAAARNSSEGMESAEEVAKSTDQDWANEATIYTFEDGSVLVASGPQLNAYAGKIYPQYKVQADKETGEWLGEAEFVDYVSRSDWNKKQILMTLTSTHTKKTTRLAQLKWCGQTK